jgi:hypothetical protein
MRRARNVSDIGAGGFCWYQKDNNDVWCGTGGSCLSTTRRAKTVSDVGAEVGFCTIGMRKIIMLSYVVQEVPVPVP